MGRTLAASVVRKGGAAAATAAAALIVADEKGFSLPALPGGQKNWEPVTSCHLTKLSAARQNVKSLVDAFYEKRGRKRKVTEIGLMRTFHTLHTNANINNKHRHADKKSSKTNLKQEDNPQITQTTAFSVLYALGFFGNVMKPSLDNAALADSTKKEPSTTSIWPSLGVVGDEDPPKKMKPRLTNQIWELCGYPDDTTVPTDKHVTEPVAQPAKVPKVGVGDVKQQPSSTSKSSLDTKTTAAATTTLTPPTPASAQSSAVTTITTNLEKPPPKKHNNALDNKIKSVTPPLPPPTTAKPHKPNKTSQPTTKSKDNKRSASTTTKSSSKSKQSHRSTSSANGRSITNSTNAAIIPSQMPQHSNQHLLYPPNHHQPPLPAHLLHHLTTSTLENAYAVMPPPPGTPHPHSNNNGVGTVSLPHLHPLLHQERFPGYPPRTNLYDPLPNPDAAAAAAAFSDYYSPHHYPMATASGLLGPLSQLHTRTMISQVREHARVLMAREQHAAAMGRSFGGGMPPSMFLNGDGGRAGPPYQRMANMDSLLRNNSNNVANIPVVLAAKRPDAQKRNQNANSAKNNANTQRLKDQTPKHTQDAKKESSKAKSTTKPKDPPPAKKKAPTKDLPEPPLSSSSSTNSKPSPATTGLRFFIPPSPPNLPPSHTKLILSAQIHKLPPTQNPQPALEYLITVGVAIPIPKALLANPFKALLSHRNLVIPKDLVIAAMTTWLWSEHCDTFRKAFAKSGRIDVDPECKWLIQTSVEEAVRVLVRVSEERGERRLGGDNGVGDLKVACLVSRSLMREVEIDEEMDSIIPNLPHLLSLLDKRHVLSLRLQCQERVLLTALLSRRLKISDGYANAYVSAMVRAGEALGHEELCDIVQNEDCRASTLLPYDILSDHMGAWEDPCRSAAGYTPEVSATELMTRAHAQAQIQKALAKLQEKFDIKGGTDSAGPYGEAPEDHNFMPNVTLPPTPTRSGSSGNALKRKASFVAANDTAVVTTLTGPAASLFNPQHYLPPLQWNPHLVENLPYGRHSTKKKSKSQQNKKQRQKNANQNNLPVKKQPPATVPIKWTDVACMFQPVSLFDPAATTPSQLNKAKASMAKTSSVTSATNIFSPYFTKRNTQEEHNDNKEDEEEEEEEDISDQTVLARHQIVLDHMKSKIEAAMQSTTHTQRRRTTG